jgi:hypothetical protein
MVFNGVAFIGALLSMRHGPTVAEFDDNHPLSVLAYPFGFGQPWFEDVTALIVILTLDLCQNAGSNNMFAEESLMQDLIGFTKTRRLW